MNLKEIEDLLKKYYEGATTLEEEKCLKNYFNNENVPDYLYLHKEQFRFYEYAQAEDPSQRKGNTEKEISNLINNENINRRYAKKRRIYYTISGIAASILIFLGVYFQFIANNNNSEYTIENTYEDPEKAYAEAKKALMLVSEKLNAGVQDFNKFSTFSQYQELITKKN